MGRAAGQLGTRINGLCRLCFVAKNGPLRREGSVTFKERKTNSVLLPDINPKTLQELGRTFLFIFIFFTF